MANLTPPIKRKGFVKWDNQVFNRPPPDGTEWRCRCGRDLFGIFYDGVLHIKYRERDAFIPEGVVRCMCRHCGHQSVIDIGSQKVSINIVHSADPEYLEHLRETLTVSAEIDATDAARELAEEHGIDLETIEGSGKDGRIVKGDVEATIH